MLIEKRRKSIKRACLIDSLPRCFLWRCQEQHNCFLSLSAPLSPPHPIHHLPLHPSSHCLLLNVSPDSPHLPVSLLLFIPLFILFHYRSQPPVSPSWSPAHFPSRDAFIGNHLKPLSDTPLILLFCNLHRDRESAAPLVLPLCFYNISPSFFLRFLITQLQWSVCFTLFVFIIPSDTITLPAWTKTERRSEKAVGHQCSTKRIRSACRLGS